MPLPIALQLYTVRDVLNQDLAAGLETIREIGYQHVELAGNYGLAAPELQQRLEDAGLKAIGSHIGLDRIKDDLPAVIDEAHTLGFRHIVCPWLAEELRSPDGYLELAHILSRAETHPDARGLTFSYHNHAFEFDPLPDGRRGLDILFSQPSPSSELDVYWVVKGGDDPQVWMNRLRGRLPLLHMKDMDDEGGFAPVGTGTIDLQTIAQIAPSIGVEALVIEQDSGWPDNDPMASARIGFENLARWVG